MTIEGNTTKSVPSSMQGHIFHADISDLRHNFRVLKMKDSLFVYIGRSDIEVFTELAMAMPMPATGECLATTIMGEQLSFSQELAVIFAKKLNKQVFLSSNVFQEQLARPALIKRFVDELKQSPNCF